MGHPNKPEFRLLEKQIERVIESLKSTIAIRLAAGEVVFVFPEKNPEHFEGIGNVGGSHLAAGNQKKLLSAASGCLIMLGTKDMVNRRSVFWLAVTRSALRLIQCVRTDAKGAFEIFESAFQRLLMGSGEY
jgi:hypothetical protein